MNLDAKVQNDSSRTVVGKKAPFTLQDPPVVARKKADMQIQRVCITI